MDTTRRSYSILLSLVALWCGMIVLAPLLQGTSESASSLIYKFFSRICHQLDERSFHVAGAKFAVCIRCSSIYFAFFAGLAFYPFVKGLMNRATPGLRWLFFASIPMFLDVFLSLTGIHTSTDATRLVTGGIFGFALPWYIMPVLFDALTIRKGEPLYARKTE